MLRVFAVILAFFALVSCGPTPEMKLPPVPDDVVAKSVYRHGGAPELVLYTMISNSSGAGAHSSLLINGSQRVIWDPAGSFRDPKIVAKNDVVYGVTPQVEDAYVRFHARETYHVVVQRLPVTADVAEAVLKRVLTHGQAQAATCANTTSTILSQVPGFEAISVTWYPIKLMEQFRALPGVTEKALYEYDDGDRFKALREYVGTPQKAE